jgi:nitrite reductase/ring-hydroxylating ferredoxin subunit
VGDHVACRWHKSSFSGAEGECVEVRSIGLVRDSKNPNGPVLRGDLDALVGAVKAGRFNRDMASPPLGVREP